MKISSLLLATVLGATSLTCSAQSAADTLSVEPARPLTATYQLEAGAERAVNTYLSPILHTGTDFAMAGSWSRRLRCPRYPLRQTYAARFSMGFMQDARRRSALTDIDLELAWHMSRELRPLRPLTLGLGAGLLIDGGLLYMPRNSNNPVAARAAISLTLNAEASYRLRIGSYRFSIFEQASLPSLGVFFAPHFGQSYYEIYLGERSGLVRCGWWGNRFAIRNHVGVELPVCGIKLRLGYSFRILSSLASDINTRITSHNFTLGISTDWINVTRKTSAYE